MTTKNKNTPPTATATGPTMSKTLTPHMVHSFVGLNLDLPKTVNRCEDEHCMLTKLPKPLLLRYFNNKKGVCIFNPAPPAQWTGSLAKHAPGFIYVDAAGQLSPKNQQHIVSVDRSAT